MKGILIVLIIVICGQYSYSQAKINEYKIMIDSAVMMQTKGSNTTPYQKGMYLIDEKDQPYTFLSELSQRRFIGIGVYERKNKKLLSKGIKAWKVLSVLNGNQLVINIIDFTITYKKGNYNYANGGGAKVIFEYSCNDKKWILIESKWVGL